MSRYIAKFQKTGYIKYTSHLDLTRLFKRVIRRSGIVLKYSQGFNPHPKMGFAQPLSLGYESICEILEFETAVPYDPDDIKNRLNNLMPEGIKIVTCDSSQEGGKTIASRIDAATYLIMIPIAEADKKKDSSQLLTGYLDQEQILELKKQKKTKALKEIDIKPMIRDLSVQTVEDMWILSLSCDCGSDSNLSPELVISSFLTYSGLQTKRPEIEVMRKFLEIK